jgi:predicted nuclease of predicted toxin-antitoxin system
MRVLLDENLPHRLREHLTGHVVETVSFNQWSGLKNGGLLKVAEASGIEVLVTGDRNLLYQQSMAARKIALVILSAQDFEIIKHKLHEIQAAVDSAAPGSFQIVDCETFKRPGRAGGSRPAEEIP